MKIYKKVSPLLNSNMYIVIEKNRAILIDPFVCEINNSLQIDLIIITHEHYDHISGVNYWKEKCDAPLLCSKNCARMILNSRTNLSKYFSVFCELQTWINLREIPESIEYVCEADNIFENEYIFDWMGYKVRLFELPGHSIGSIGIQVGEDTFFSGDSLIKNHTTECFPPSGNKELWETITKPKIKGLDNNIYVYPGHFDGFYLYEYENW